MDWEGDFDFEGLAAKVVAARPIAALKAAEHVRGVSASKAPIEHGHLAASAEARPAGDGAEVYYPGPYARYQEFGLDFHHPIHGQALYLTEPMIQEAPAAVQIMADTIREVISE